MRFRIFTSIVCIIALLTGFSSCILNEDKPQSDYHENVKDFEMYVLSELSDYIVFDAPNIEKSYRYGDSNETLIWFVYFRRQYFYSNQVNEIPPESIIIRVRDMYNKYVNDNPDYYLNRFVVDLRFSAPPWRKSDTSQMYIRYTHLSNYDYMLGGKSGNNLSTINNVSSEWSYFFADNN